MVTKLRLAEAMNTYNPALLTLRQKGYHVYVVPNDKSEWQDWRAQKDGREFIATDPLTLLGLIAMWEHRGDNWHLDQGEPALYDVIRSAAYDDRDDAI